MVKGKACENAKVHLDDGINWIVSHFNGVYHIQHIISIRLQ